MLKKFYTFACAVAMLAGIAGNSFAASISSVIVQNGTLARLSDNSLEALWNAGQAPGTGDTIVAAGDRLLAIGRVDQVSSPFGTPDKLFGTAPWTDEFTFVSIIEVATVTPPPGGVGNYTFTFQPAPAALPASLGLAWAPGTMIAFYSDPANNYTGAPATIAAGVAEASGGTPWWQLGMNGGLPGEFWTASASTNDISQVALIPPGTNPVGFSFAIDLLAQLNGIALVPVTGDLEMTGNGNVFGPDPAGQYQLVDDYNLFIRTVPEPGSMAIFGLLGLAPLARRFRRK